MNRPIKFRAWIPPEQIMVEVSDLNWNLFGLAVGWNSEESVTGKRSNIAPANYNLMQFTGLLDKNGKEIYEGDIVEGKIRTNDVSLGLFNRAKEIKAVEFKHPPDDFNKKPHYTVWLEYKLRGIVEWDAHSANFRVKDLNNEHWTWRLFCGGGDMCAETGRIEVVGNIYEK